MLPDEIELRRKALDETNKARAIHETAAAEKRDLSSREQGLYDAAMGQHTSLLMQADDLGRSRGTHMSLEARMVDGMATIGSAGPATPRTRRAPAVGMPREILQEVFADARSGRYAQDGAPFTPQSALTSASTGGGGQQIDYTDRAFEFRRDVVRIADLCKIDTTDRPTIEYMRGTTAASAAASVAEGALKPESAPNWTKVQATAIKIAHRLDVTHEALEDFPLFAQLVEQEMYEGLLNEENRQLLVGAGGVDLVGLVNTPGILTYAPVAAERRLESIRKALTLLQTGPSFLAEVTDLALVINPADAQIVDMTFASGSGEFLASDASSSGPAGAIWGVRKVITNRIPGGTALLGSFKDAATVYYRKLPMLMVDPFSQSANNITRMIAEERLLLAVERPASLVKITYNGAA